MKLEYLLTKYVRSKGSPRELQGSQVKPLRRRADSVEYAASTLMKLAKSPSFNKEVLHYGKSNQMVKTKPSSVVPAVCLPHVFIIYSVNVLFCIHDCHSNLIVHVLAPVREHVLL
jgi:hypothetical protein